MFDYKCVGIDVFLISKGGIPKLPENAHGFKLEMISQRGMRCWPGPVPEGIILDWFHCRYLSAAVTEDSIKNLLQELEKTVTWEKVQKLWNDKGQDLFSKVYES